MENAKNMAALIEQATSPVNSGPSIELYEKILGLINSRMDMPKACIATIGKRIAVKNKQLLLLCFDLLEYLTYNLELSFFTQIASKDFLFKVSGLLMSKDVDPSATLKILQVIKVWEDLFRPYQDLLPLFFHFEAGLLRKQFQIPHDYISPYKRERRISQKPKENDFLSKKPYKAPTKAEIGLFQSIRENIIVTNDIISNADPSQIVNKNALLNEMMDQIKQCQKKVSQTINKNPSEEIMQIALAVNDDIYITYRRFKDLQRSRKPEAFILTQLVSEKLKDTMPKTKQQTNDSQPKVKNQPPKLPEKKKEIDIFSMDDDRSKTKKPTDQSQPLESQASHSKNVQAQKPGFTKVQQPKKTQQDIFDLLSEPNPQVPQVNSGQSGQLNNNNNKGLIDLMDSLGMNEDQQNWQNQQNWQGLQSENNYPDYPAKENPNYFSYETETAVPTGITLASYDGPKKQALDNEASEKKKAVDKLINLDEDFLGQPKKRQ